MSVSTITAQADLSRRSLFLVWGPPSHGPRSRVLARELGIESLHYIYSTTRRGLLAAPLKYSYQALATFALLLRERPRLVFVQSPPSFAVLAVFVYCLLSGARYVVDAHSDALQRRIWTWPGWLHRGLARRAITTIVTNEHMHDTIQSWGGNAFVLRDIPTTFKQSGVYPLGQGFNVVFVNTFARDEPLREVLAAARSLPEVQFYITGRKGRAQPEDLAAAPPNVHFTDFLPDEDYYALLASVQAVMCLTTRDHTMQRGACEALSLGTPIITSDWPLLRSYFGDGAAYVQNTSAGICEGIQALQSSYDEYQRALKAVQATQRHTWQSQRAALIALVRGASPAGEQRHPEGTRETNEQKEA
ncbi:MAG TPA: glycosyltransferase [Herpetosiphonaceae bacterium]